MVKFRQEDDKKNDFDLDIVNFQFLDGDIHQTVSSGVYISPLIRPARVSFDVNNFNNRIKVLTSELLKKGHRYHKLRIVL